MKAPRAGHTTDSDVAGPFSTPTKGGNRYLSTLVDRDTKKIDGKMVASQGEFFDHYTEFVKMAEAHFGKPNIFSILHSDSDILQRLRKAPSILRQKRYTTDLLATLYTGAQRNSGTMYQNDRRDGADVPQRIRTTNRLLR